MSRMVFGAQINTEARPKLSRANSISSSVFSLVPYDPYAHGNDIKASSVCRAKIRTDGYDMLYVLVLGKLMDSQGLAAK